jgi:alpha-aminoadipate carrier protein LysW
MSTRTQLSCEVCGAALAPAPDVTLNELIECADCGTEFEVTGLSPLTVVEAPLEEEDWGE